MKRLLLTLAVLAVVSLASNDALARGRVRARVGHRHHVHRHHYRPVYRHHAYRVYRAPVIYRHGYHFPYRHYHHGGFGGVYYGSPGFSIGIRF